MYDKGTKSCNAKADDGCQIRYTKGNKVDQYDKKSCQGTDGCAYIAEECVKIDHPCNVFDKKNKCLKSSPKEGLKCQYKKSKTGFSCIDFPEFSFGGTSKKKTCQSWKSLGCAYGKKEGKDRPPGIKAKCYDMADPLSVEWEAAGRPKPSKTKKVKKCKQEKAAAKCEKNPNGCYWDETAADGAGGSMDQQ